MAKNNNVYSVGGLPVKSTKSADEIIELINNSCLNEAAVKAYKDSIEEKKQLAKLCKKNLSVGQEVYVRIKPVRYNYEVDEIKMCVVECYTITKIGTRYITVKKNIGDSISFDMNNEFNCIDSNVGHNAELHLSKSSAMAAYKREKLLHRIFWNIENGKHRNLPLDKISQISDLLGLEISELHDETLLPINLRNLNDK